MSSSEVNRGNFLIQMEDIKPATGDFNKIEDNCGNKFYRGQLSESWGNRTVVIKRRKLNDNEKKGEVSEALKIATSFHHDNIITFIGYCFEDNELFKVQEYAINGSLHDYLQNKSKKRNLTWPQRLKICISAARGLKHLHDSRVIHGNFSCFAILLDENLEAKITKFGSSVLVPESHPYLQIYSSLPQRGDGKMYDFADPIYEKSKILNLEADVYSYGLVLFQILSGILHYHYGRHIEGYDAHDLIYFVRHFYDDDLLDKLIDPSLKDQIDHESFRKFTEIAYKCISFNIKDRPKMDGIIKTLEEALKIHNQAVASTIHRQSPEPLEEFLIPMEEIEKATQNFHAKTKVNHQFYRGELSDSHRKAVIFLHGSIKGFRQELKIFSRLHHDNIIRFIGYNDIGSNKIIVSEYAVNGTLDKHLRDSHKRCLLTWEIRLKICLGAARGLKYLQLGLGEYKCVIHGNFHSGKILLDDKLEAKIRDFRKSILVPKNARYTGILFETLPFKRHYVDPVFAESRILKSEADVYSFGVVLFEILSGILGYDLHSDDTRDGMNVVQQYHEATIDPSIRDQIDARSLDTFKEIAYKCISYNPKDRPLMSTVVKRIEEALYIQNHGAVINIDQKDKKLEDFKIPLEEINLAIGVKDQDTCVGTGGFGVVYRGKLSERWQNRRVAVKYLQPNGNKGLIELNFRRELEMILNFNHQNIIPFIGYCDEGSEKIIVYEFAANGSLDDYLVKEDNRRRLTWTQRLKICLGAARGLDYLHSGLGEDKRVIHRDVKSGNILLDDKLEAKICDFGLSKSDTTIGQTHTHEITNAAGTNFYMDPVYHEGGVLRKESDVYSFGVVMFEMLSGMLVYNYRSFEDGKPAQPLLYQVRRYYDQIPEALIDPFIREEIKTRSFNTFKNIAIQCISFNSKERPTMEVIVDQLEEALGLQNDTSQDKAQHETTQPPGVIKKRRPKKPTWMKDFV